MAILLFAEGYVDCFYWLSTGNCDRQQKKRDVCGVTDIMTQHRSLPGLQELTTENEFW